MRHTPRGASCLADAHQSSCRNGQFRLPLTRVGPLTACPRIAAASCVSAGTCASASPVRPPAVFRTQLMLRPSRAWTRTQIHGDFSRADTTAMRGPRRGFCLVSVVTSITRGSSATEKGDVQIQATRVAGSGQLIAQLLEGCFGTGFSMAAIEATPIDYRWPKVIRVRTAVAVPGSARLVHRGSCTEARAPRVVHRGWCTRSPVVRCQRCLSVTGFQAWIAASTLT